MTLIPKDIRDLNSEEALTLQVHHILKMQQHLIGELCDGADAEFLKDLEVSDINEVVERFLKNNPKPLVIEPFPVYDEEPQSYSPDNYSDDGEALASAGFGTDEDYGGGDERL